MTKPMTEEETDKFLADYPKPWRHAQLFDHEWIESSNGEESYVPIELVLSYIAYIEQRTPTTQEVLREKVHEALRNALDNGYEIKAESSRSIAADMQDTSTELEPFDLDHITDVVAEAIAEMR